MIKVRPSGPEDARIMVVGEAPGAMEVQGGAPFIGPAGNVLRELLNKAGVSPDECFLTNLVPYQPPGNRLATWYDQRGTPNETVQAGLAELAEQIRQVRPNVIYALGNFPLHHLTGKGRWSKTKEGLSYVGISDYRGSVLEGNDLAGGCKVVAGFHPSYLLRSVLEIPIARLDTLRVVSESVYPDIRRPSRDITIDPRGADRDYWRDRLLNDTTVPLTTDIETRRDGTLLCLGATRRSSEAVTFVMRGDADIAFIRMLLAEAGDLCFQNGMFDASMLEWHYKIECMKQITHDTMVCQHAAYLEFPKSLDFLASIYTDQPYYKDMVSWKDIASGKQSVETVWQYNAIDTWVTAEVREKQVEEELTDPATCWAFEHEMKLIYPLWDMSKRGIKVDAEGMQRESERLAKEATTLTHGLSVVAGKPVNVKSGPDVAALLYTKLGLPIIKRTDSGAPSCDNKTVSELERKATDPTAKMVIQMLRKAREARDLRSKFTDIELSADGRMRGMYNPAKTTTGRLASSQFVADGTGGNQQNFPRKDFVRRMFLPDDGMEFGYSDLERAESLVVAKVTGDKEMLRIHGEGMDAHTITAAFLFDIEERMVTKDMRFMGKKTRHAGNYMQGWKTFMENFNADSDEHGMSLDAKTSKLLIDKYKALHPKLVTWWHDTEAQLRRTRTLTSLLGRKRVFYGRLDAILPEAVAFVPQSTVGDAINVGLHRCFHDPLLQQLEFQLLLQVHDAIGFQYPTENREGVLPRVRQLLRVDLTVPRTKEVFAIPVEIACGPNWGDCKVWKEDLKLQVA